jgi:hypothetical protein
MIFASIFLKTQGGFENSVLKPPAHHIPYLRIRNSGQIIPSYTIVINIEYFADIIIGIFGA